MYVGDKSQRKNPAFPCRLLLESKTWDLECNPLKKLPELPPGSRFHLRTVADIKPESLRDYWGCSLRGNRLSLLIEDQ